MLLENGAYQNPSAVPKEFVDLAVNVMKEEDNINIPANVDDALALYRHLANKHSKLLVCVHFLQVCIIKNSNSLFRVVVDR